MKALYEFERDNEEEINKMWEEHLSMHHFGSGEDFVYPDDDMYWEFVGDIYLDWRK